MATVDIPLTVLLAAGSLVAAYLVAMLVVSVVVSSRGSGSRISEMFTGWFSEQSDEFDRRGRRSRIEHEIRRALGLADEWGAQARADVVKAARASLEISVLYKLLRQSAQQCNTTHFAVADGLASPEMNEAARHPLCGSRRQRVIDLADLLCDKVEGYPLISDAPELIRVRFGVESIPTICTRCPYWTVTRATAPAICPTNAMLGPVSAAASDTTEDGGISHGSYEDT